MPILSEQEGSERKIEELTQRISELEASLHEITRPYTELVQQLGQFQGTVEKYFRLMNLYQEHGSISIDMILPDVKDSISKEIIHIVLDRPGINISQVTDQLRVHLGSASRRIVRGRLDELVKKGHILERKGKRSRTYEVSGEVLKKWSQMAGLIK